MTTQFKGKSLFACCLGIAISCLAATRASAQIRINEIDADTQGTDTQEFVELYDGGVGNQSLTGKVLVFYDGFSDTSYYAIDLDGFSTNAQGYFIVGNAAVVPAPSIIFPDNTLQNGADAVALYQANGSNFPNGTALTLTNLLDAVVYGTDDPDDAELLTLLNAGQPQVNEGGSGNSTLVSISRCPNGSGGLRNTASYTQTTPTPLAASNCPPTTGGCCNGATCSIQTPAGCAAISGGVFLGLGSTCSPNPCPVSYPGVKLNEIRIDHTGTDSDEYAEIVGNPGTSLNGLTYIVIGDSTGGLSGVIERATSLTGQVIPADGHWLGAGHTGAFVIAPAAGGATPDFFFEVDSNIFENSDTVTHMLVSGFTGTLGQDLDATDDCTLDSTPWTSVIDRVSLVLCAPPTNPCAGTECSYGANASELVGPDGTFVPGHIYRLPDATGPWQIGPFAITDSGGLVNSLDTPGKTNTDHGACCQGGTCSIETRDDCINGLAGIFKGAGSTCAASTCTGACCTGATCSVTDPGTCAAGGGVFQGSGTNCTTLPPNPACGTCQTITQVRALAAGTRVKLCNVRISSTTDLIQSGTVKSFQIEDTSGPGGRSGLTVFGSNAQVDAILNVANEGTQLSIQGTTSNFNGLLELADGSLPLAAITIGANVGTLPIATVTTVDLQDLSATAENFESEIVRLSCVTFLDGNGTNVFAGGTATSNYLVTDGVNNATIRIASNALDFEGQTIPVGPVTITGVFSQNDTVTPFDSSYQIQPRDMFGPHNDLNTNPSCGPTGACCLPGPTCQEGLNANLCAGIGGVYRGDGSLCVNQTCPTVDGTVINEIRIDQDGPDNDEYFELKGPPNVPLGSLTYLVIGDGTPEQGSGVIEAAIPLTHKVSPADGIFVAAEDTFTLGPVDLTLTANGLNFENDDNVTHLLVENFNGAVGDDLDTDDDGFLDAAPWSRVLSSIALVSDFSSPPVGTEWYYGPTVGPAPGGSSPAHVIRCAGALNGFIIGSVDLPPTGNDTPGAENNCANACLTCYGDTDASQRVDINDTDEFVAALLGIAPNVCADVDLNGTANGDDINNFIFLIMANGGAGTSCLPPTRRDVVRCDNAPSPCPDVAAGFCIYTVDPNQAGIAPCVVASSPGPNQLIAGETICVKCPVSANCGLPGDKAQFRWVNYDGLGNDCNFYATLVSTNCSTCGAGNKRFGDAPPPLSLKVMNWNLLNYTGSDRTAAYQAVLNSIQADVIIAEEVVGTTGANAFLNTVLNGAGGPGAYSMATFTDGPDSDNAVFYRSSHVGYAGAADHVVIPTDLRNVDRWRLTVVGFTGPQSEFYVYACHLKAGNTAPDANQRHIEATAVRNNANALPANSNFIIAGDMNLYTSAEAAYVDFTGSQVDNDGRAFDPINSPGAWNANSAFRFIHTQSPHNNNPGAPAGASNGGLDDRFDFLLCSQAMVDGVALTYRNGTYRAFGQDGLHFNNDINDPPTIPEGATIADALHSASDHLPVVMEILLP